jgi:hypothetical protein
LSINIPTAEPLRNPEAFSDFYPDFLLTLAGCAILMLTLSHFISGQPASYCGIRKHPEKTSLRDEGLRNQTSFLLNDKR